MAVRLKASSVGCGGLARKSKAKVKVEGAEGQGPRTKDQGQGPRPNKEIKGEEDFIEIESTPVRRDEI